MSTPNDTLRAHLEAIRDRHYRTKFDECGWCCGGFPCPNYTDAVAALRILDEANFFAPPAPSKGQRYVLVPDPGGRAAPPPTTPEDAQSAAGSSSTTSRITHE